MAITPDSLNDPQARQAVKLFYDLLPPSRWDGGRKPSGERVGTVVRVLSEEAAAPARATLSALLDADSAQASGKQAAQAALARIVLTQALRSADTAPMVQQAIDEAAKPNMGLLDPRLGELIIGMLLATTTFDRDADGSLHVHLGGGAAGILSALKVPELLEKLPAVLAALPASVLAHLL